MRTICPKITLESYVLAAICMLDLATTVFWVSYRNAAEGNPLMAFYLHHGGTAGFIAAKLVLIAPPLFIAEWARRTRPEFVRRSLRLGICAYIGLYGVGVAHVNRTDTEDALLREAAAQQYAVLPPTPIPPELTVQMMRDSVHRDEHRAAGRRSRPAKPSGLDEGLRYGYLP